MERNVCLPSRCLKIFLPRYALFIGGSVRYTAACDAKCNAKRKTQNALVQARSKLQQLHAITIVLRWSIDLLFSSKWRMRCVRQRNVWEEGAQNKSKERIQEVRYAKVSPASVWIAALYHHAIRLDHFLETLSDESSCERSSFSKRIESFASLRRVCSPTRCVLLAN